MAAGRQTDSFRSHEHKFPCSVWKIRPKERLRNYLRVSLSEEAWSRSLDVPAEALLDGFWSQGLGLRMDDNLNIEGPVIAHDEPSPTILSGLLLVLLFMR